MTNEVLLPPELEGKSAITRIAKLEPATVRGAVLAITSLIAVVLGRNIDISWLEPLLNAWAIAAPLIAGVLIRQKVVPEVKANTATVVLGEVTSKIDVIYNEIARNVEQIGRNVEEIGRHRLDDDNTEADNGR